MPDQQHVLDGSLVPGLGGRSVLLLHSLALDRTIWDEHVATLQDQLDVLTVDLPGHGGSRHVRSASIAHMADRVADFLRARSSGPVIVAGLSLGGSVAQALTTRHPDVVSGLCLCDTTAWYGESAKEDWAARARRAREEGMAALSDFQLARWFSGPFLQARPEVGRRLLDVFQSNDIDDYEASCTAMGEMDLRADIEAIRVPTTILVGELDTATPVSHAQDLASRIPDSQLIVVPGCSHLSPLEKPGRFVTAVTELVERVEAEPSLSTSGSEEPDESRRP